MKLFSSVQNNLIFAMGGCISSPTDIHATNSSIQTSEDGSAEAALIYSNNVHVSSKVTVSFCLTI